jgi:hypothetical protein
MPRTQLQAQELKASLLAKDEKAKTIFAESLDALDRHTHPPPPADHHHTHLPRPADSQASSHNAPQGTDPKSVRFETPGLTGQTARAEQKAVQYSANAAVDSMAALRQAAAEQSPWQREQRISRDIAMHKQVLHSLTQQKVAAQHEQADKVHSSNTERIGATARSTQRLAAREMLSSSGSQSVEHALDLAASGASSRGEGAASGSMGGSHKHKRPKPTCRQNPSWNSLTWCAREEEEEEEEEEEGLFKANAANEDPERDRATQV